MWQTLLSFWLALSGKTPTRPARRRPAFRRPSFRPCQQAGGKPMLEALEDRLAPATLTVNSTADNITDTTVMTLRAAVNLIDSGGASAAAPGVPAVAPAGAQTVFTGSYGTGDTIQFDPSVFGSTAQTITLGGTELLLSSNVNINGPGANELAISGGHHTGQIDGSRVFEINTPDLAAIIVGALGVPQNSNVTAVISGLTIESGYSHDYGGGIHNNGTLTLSDCAISGNSSFQTTFGGSPGLENFGRLTVNNCTFSDNIGANGGGVVNYYGTGTITNSTFSGNFASNAGGAIFEYGTATNSDPLTLTNCTLSGNTAGVVGGGLFNFHGTPIVGNTIIAGNNSSGDPDFGGSTLVSNGYNLIGIGTSRGLRGFGNTGDQVGTATNPIDPGLDPQGLQNHGGPTQTIALVSGSLASGAGSVALAVDANGNPLLTDQRGFGFLRTVNGTVDIGAYQTQPTLSPRDYLETVVSGTLPVDPTTGSPTAAFTLDTQDQANAFMSVFSSSNTSPLTVPQGSATPIDISVSLGSGIQVNEADLSIPSGFRVRINGGTWLGGSPALTLRSGDLTITNATFQNATDAPTILVTGGSLTLRDDVIQESTGYSDAAISVTGGTVDLGTAASPGGNKLNVNGAGVFVSNATSSPVAAVGDTFTVNGAPLAPSSLSGLVFADFNDDGQVDFGEQGIPGVTVTLTGTDAFGNPVSQSQQTDTDGTFLFSGLLPGSYHLTETQPAGYGQGIDSVGTAGGSLVATDEFFVQLGSGVNGQNYNYAEQPPAGGAVQKGQTAGIGFWNNKNGQALILALNGGASSTQLGDWLAATFKNVYGADSGNDLTGKSNADVAALFQSDFRKKGPKLDAQMLATALSVYVTNATLDPTKVAASYGFTVSGYGLGTATVNVGSDGAAFGVANNTTLTVLDALLAADAQAVNGLLYNGNTTKRNEANDLFSAINQAGGIN
jgi:hypothetical protein